VRLGLIIVAGDTYTVKGMAAERERRSHAGLVGATVRWDSERNANASANGMPSTSTSTSRDIPPTPTSGGRRANGSHPRALSTNPRAVAAREATKKRNAKNEIKRMYYRGEITEAECDQRIAALNA
jgi:hypothetical protein